LLLQGRRVAQGAPSFYEINKKSGTGYEKLNNVRWGHLVVRLSYDQKQENPKSTFR
jgi:hypothetical protein